MRKLYIISIFLLFFYRAIGQQTYNLAFIKGTVLDDKKEPILGAIIELQQNGITKFGIATDEDGKYNIKSIPYGNYTLKVIYSSYNTDSSTLEINSNTITKNIQLQLKPNAYQEVYLICGLSSRLHRNREYK